MLLVDASNAFNSLNLQVALHNICPPLATILVNTYRAPTELFVDGDVLYILSRGYYPGRPTSYALLCHGNHPTH